MNFFHNPKFFLTLQILSWFWFSNKNRASKPNKDLNFLPLPCASSSDGLFPCGLDDGFLQICNLCQRLPETVPEPVPASGMALERASGMALERALEMALERASEMVLGRASEMVQGRAPGMALERAPGMALERAPGMALERAPGMALERAPGMALERAPGMALEKVLDSAAIKEIRINTELRDKNFSHSNLGSN